MKQISWTLVLIVVGALGSVGEPASATLFGAKFEVVTMTFEGGDSCVAVDPESAVIYRNRKPKRVRWRVETAGKYWEIRYQGSGASDPGKKDGAGDYFATSGSLNIGCSGSKVSTELPAALTPANASWPYMIKVYECDGGSRGDFVCELDPTIDWGD